MNDPGRPALLFDVQAVQGEQPRSTTARATAALALALVRHAPERVRLLLDPDRPRPGGLAVALAAEAPLRWATRAELRAALAAPGGAVHVIGAPWEPVPQDGLLPRAVAEAGVPVVAVVHDASAALVAADDAAGRTRQQERAALLRRCDLVATTSQADAAALVAQLGVDPGRIVVVGAGTSPGAHPPAAGQDPTLLLRRVLPGLAPGFLLHVAGTGAADDLRVLVAAFARLPAELRRAHPLVVVADGADRAPALWPSSGVDAGLGAGELVVLDAPDDATAVALHQGTRLALAVAGRGGALELLDALACGAPLLAVRTPSSVELLDGAAAPATTVAPGDVDALAAGLADALSGAPPAAELRHAAAATVLREHTWAGTAARLVQAVDARLATAGRTPARAVATRVAVVSPFPPSPSGVATYTERVVQAMAERVEVTRFRDGSDLTAEDAAVGRLLPAGALGRTVATAGFDHHLYVLGNSGFHRQVLAVARRHPGVAWLHEASLAGAYLTSAHHARNGDVAMDHTLDAGYAGLVAPAVQGAARMDFAAYERTGTRLLGEVVRASRGVIVTTQLARALLEADLGPLARLPPIVVVPLASPPAPTPVPREDPPLVVCLGWVNAFKAPDAVLAAFALVRAQRPCRLAFVGPVDPPELRDELLASAHRLGIGDDVTVTGALDQAGFERWSASARCALQLRTSSAGEASATVLEALAAGVPVVTSVATAHDLDAEGLEVVPTQATPDEVAAAVRRALDHVGPVRPPARTQADVADEVLSFLASLPR